MKHLNHLILMGISLLMIFTSCGDDISITNEAEDYSDLIQELEMDAEFINFISNRQAFFNDIKNHKINLIGVSDMIGDFTKADFCQLKDNYEGHLKKDVRLFSKYNCEEIFLLKILTKKYPDFAKAKKVIYAKYSNPGNTIETREIDCLWVFTTHWDDDTIMCAHLDPTTAEYFDCVNRYQMLALYNYEKCCERSDTIGCPP